MNNTAPCTPEHDLLRRGTWLHQAGKLTEAVACYQRALVVSPGNPEALFLLGSLANQKQRFDLGAQLIEQAVASNGSDARYHTELGVAYVQLERNVKAARHFRKAIEIDPDFSFAWFNLGNRYLDQNDTRNAIKHLHKACTLDPNRAEYAFNLGTAYQQSGQLDLALQQYQNASALQHGFAEPMINAGSILLGQKQWDRAAEMYAAVLEFSPGDIRALHGLATSYLEKQDTERAYETLLDLGGFYLAAADTLNAIACYEKAARLREDNKNALYNLGLAFMQADELDLAREALTVVVEKAPDFESALNNLGVVHNRSGNTGKAEELFTVAARLGSAPAHINLGNLHSNNGHRDRALSAYQAAVAISPGNPDAYLNLANEQLLCGHIEDSEASLRLAIARYSGDTGSVTNLAMAHTNLADLLLGQGRFSEGWNEYQWRHGIDHRNPLDPGTTFRDVNSILSPGTEEHPVVVIPDQGLGDEIFFLRFAERLKTTPSIGSLQVYASDAISSMLQRSLELNIRPVSTLARNTGLAPFAVRVGDLPLLTGMDSFDAVMPPVRLAPLSNKIDDARKILADSRPPYLGITWRAGTSRVGGLNKHVPIDQLSQAILQWPGTVVVLQRHPEQNELERFKSHLPDGRLLDMSGHNDNLEDMLALLSLLDEYVGVSNTNMHLLASIGKQGRCLVPYPADWRWLSEGDMSPWFPGFSLYRQSVAFEWSDAIISLRQDLAATLSAS